MLDLHWLTPGYPPDSTPPNMSLTFEVWRDGAGHRFVRAYVLTQRPEQLREGPPLTTANPPDRAPVFIPGCSTAGEGYPCDWDTFQRIVGAAFDPAFVRPVVDAAADSR
jgi:4-phytase/acid phosphatase